MSTTTTLRPLLDRKQWEMCNPCPTASAVGAFVVTDSTGVDKDALFVNSTTVHYLYDHNQDGYTEIPASGIAGTFGAGACGTFVSNGPTGTASAGSSTTLTTTLTIPRDLSGFIIRLTGGTGAGQQQTIVSNTYGANSVITTGAWSVTPDNTTTYMIQSGRYYFFCPSATAPGFAYYDRATNTWTQRSVTGLATAWTIDARLVATIGAVNTFASGTATSGSATTIVNSGKAWATNQWTNFQVRVTAGANAGKVAVITSNTGTTLTFPTMTTACDSTTQYVIEGNDDAIYLLGNNAVTMYKYSISGNSWATVTPGVARAGAAAAGFSASWVSQVVDSRWANENTILNGKYIYSFRGGATATLDFYDIAANTWNSALSYGASAATFTTGSAFDSDDNYIYCSKDATGRVFRYDVANQILTAFNHLLYADSTAIVGDKLWTKVYTDGATTIHYIYRWRNTGTELFRCMVI